MRFYPVSPLKLGLYTTLFIVYIAVSLYQALHRHPWMGLGGVLLGSIYLGSLWRRYWEIRPDGSLYWCGWGAQGTISTADLRYAGPVRNSPGYPVSSKRDIELDWGGVRRTRFVRVDDRSGFLEHLRSAAPNAEVVCWTGSANGAKSAA